MSLRMLTILLRLLFPGPAGKPLAESGYEVAPKSLTIKSPPAGDFDLEVVTAIKPQDNSLLEGLYKSGGNYCTQVSVHTGDPCVCD